VISRSAPKQRDKNFFYTFLHKTEPGKSAATMFENFVYTTEHKKVTPQRYREQQWYKRIIANSHPKFQTNHPHASHNFLPFSTDMKLQNSTRICTSEKWANDGEKSNIRRI
jgi:hypothetical protein